MKRWVFPLVAFMVVALVLTGCAQSTTPSTKAPAPAPEAAKVWVRIDGGSVGSTKNFKQELMAEIFRKAHPEWNVRVIAGITGATAWTLMASGQMEITNESAADLISASTLGDMAGIKVPKIDGKFFMCADAYAAQLILDASVPINSIPELIQKKYPLKLVVGRPGTAPRSLSDMVLAAYGTSNDQIVSWGGKLIVGSGVDAADALGDGLADGWITCGGIPQITIQEIANRKSLKLITVTEPEIIAKLKEKGFLQTLVPKGGYSFQDKDMITVEVPQVQMVRADYSDQIVTEMTKICWTNRDYLIKGYSGFSDYLTPKYLTAVVQNYDKWVHPAAKKYLAEQGIK